MHEAVQCENHGDPGVLGDDNGDLVDLRVGDEARGVQVEPGSRHLKHRCKTDESR
jgi:hypothetical protein